METARLNTEVASVETDSSAPLLQWRVSLLRQQPKKMLLVAPIVLVSLLVSVLVFRSLMFTAVTLLLFAGSLADYLFPTCYEVDADGASARTLVGKTRIEWDRVKKYYLDDYGIKLSPLGTQSRLEAYRGVYLRFGDNRDEVVQVVRMIRDGRNRGTDPRGA